MTSPMRIAAALLLPAVLLGCQATDQAEPDWPETITYERLALTNSSGLIEQSYALPPQALIDVLQDPSQTIHRRYPVQGPTGHGSFMGTDVYYVTGQGQFYLRSDCGQGHYDGYIGPFDGDPRVVLRP